MTPTIRECLMVAAVALAYAGGLYVRDWHHERQRVNRVGVEPRLMFSSDGVRPIVIYNAATHTITIPAAVPSDFVLAIGNETKTIGEWKGGGT